MDRIEIYNKLNRIKPSNKILKYPFNFWSPEKIKFTQKEIELRFKHPEKFPANQQNNYKGNKPGYKGNKPNNQNNYKGNKPNNQNNYKGNKEKNKENGNNPNNKENGNKPNDQKNKDNGNENQNDQNESTTGGQPSNIVIVF